MARTRHALLAEKDIPAPAPPTSPPTAPWRNRIVRYGDEDPTTLVPNDANFRIHPQIQKDTLQGVLEEVGIVQNVIVNARTGRIVDGHLRVEQALRTFQATIPVTWVDLSDEEEHTILATIDPIAAMAEQDAERLDSLLASVRTDSGAVQALLDALGAEATARMAASRAPDALPDPGEGGDDFDTVPEEGGTTVTTPGDVWVLGAHRMIVGDCRDEDVLARLMGDDLADLIWTDPPYGVNYVGKTKDALTLSNDHEFGIESLIEDAFSSLDAVLKPGGPIYVCHPAGALNVTFGRCFLAQGWRLHQTLIWVKDSMVLGHSDYHFKHEPIFFGYKALPEGEGGAGRGRANWYGGHAEVSVFAIPRPKRSEEHPTQKPVELVEHMIRNSCHPHGIVLDGFLGSGSTLIAAHRQNRRCFACEIDPAFADVVLRRYTAETGLEPTLESRD